MTKRKPPGGKHRAKIDVDRIEAMVEVFLLYGKNREEIVRGLAEVGHPTALRTLDNYIHRIRVTWAEEAAAARAQARERQLRRLYTQLGKLNADGKHDEVYKREKLIARIEGNLAPLLIQEVKKVGWDDLTAEQLQYMRENKGRLPPGVTAEMLRTRG